MPARTLRQEGHPAAATAGESALYSRPNRRVAELSASSRNVGIRFAASRFACGLGTALGVPLSLEVRRWDLRSLSPTVGHGAVSSVLARYHGGSHASCSGCVM